MIPIGGRSLGYSSLLDVQVAAGPLVDLSTLRPTSNKPVEPTSSDELLDLISELNAFLHVVAVVMMVDAELIRIALPGVHAHPFRPWELLSNFH